MLGGEGGNKWHREKGSGNFFPLEISCLSVQEQLISQTKRKKKFEEENREKREKIGGKNAPREMP